MNTPQLLVAAATADITPPPGHLLGGYVDRTEPATGTADPLRAVLIWLSGPADPGVLWLTLDAVAVDTRALSFSVGRLRAPARRGAWRGVGEYYEEPAVARDDARDGGQGLRVRPGSRERRGLGQRTGPRLVQRGLPDPAQGRGRVRRRLYCLYLVLILVIETVNRCHQDTRQYDWARGQLDVLMGGFGHERPQ